MAKVQGGIINAIFYNGVFVVFYSFFSAIEIYLEIDSCLRSNPVIFTKVNVQTYRLSSVHTTTRSNLRK